LESPFLLPRMCIYGWLLEHARSCPAAPALLASGRDTMTYARLLAQVEKSASALKAVGIRREDRVAIALPNGAEAAVAFLAASSVATSAPLNPSYREEEFRFYLSDLNAKALLVQRGEPSAVRGVAADLGIRVFELSPELEGPAGAFSLNTDAGSSQPPELAAPDDVALVLHTSGTTSRPKMVPLSHHNLVTSADSIRSTLRLTPEDRCLNVMPLFHIHGLIGAVLSSIVAGGSIVCTPGFQAPLFFGWLREFQPTWYSAVPTIHQAILTRAEKESEAPAQARLRFIRSSSSALPPQVAARLEDVFEVPVIESYGMTEASHQMASNPLPPGRRKPGSVGLPAGPEIAVMDADGQLQGAGNMGEVVIRGPNVTAGYLNNPAANAAAFSQGWFRTGDLGYLDEDGYLYLTGRLKEIINRGGEKISPREIDEVLLDHPAVLQAVAFAFPHHRLGEEVGAAVVLRAGCSVSERDLQEFAAKRLVDFKVPAKIVFLERIPTGPTGKLQRIGLAATLGITGAPAVSRDGKAALRPPATDTENRIGNLWRDILDMEDVGIDDNFFDCGGDSVLALRLIARIEEETDQTVSVRDLAAQTLSQLASQLDSTEGRVIRSQLRLRLKRLARAVRGALASLRA